jgi:predicted RNA-binding Zn ribbon-like protein
MPVVLGAIALTGVGFAIAALVGTGADASSGTSLQTITQKITQNGTTSTVVHTRKVVKQHVVTRHGKAVTIPGSTVNLLNTVTAPGATRTSTQKIISTKVVTGPTVITTLTVPTTVVSVQTLVSTLTLPQVTVTLPPVTVTVPPTT